MKSENNLKDLNASNGNITQCVCKDSVHLGPDPTVSVMIFEKLTPAQNTHSKYLPLRTLRTLRTKNTCNNYDIR